MCETGPCDHAIKQVEQQSRSHDKAGRVKVVWASIQQVGHRWVGKTLPGSSRWWHQASWMKSAQGGVTQWDVRVATKVRRSDCRSSSCCRMQDNVCRICGYAKVRKNYCLICESVEVRKNECVTPIMSPRATKALRRIVLPR